MTTEEQAAKFDVNGPGIPGQLFGLPFTLETAQLIIIPVPWEATVSYKVGTAKGPAAVLKASQQIDSFVKEIPDAFRTAAGPFAVPTL